MWAFLASFLSGPLKEVSNDLRQAYQARLNAANDAEKIAADERIALLEARESTIRAAQSNPIEGWVRPLIALGPIVYLNKLFIWDKVLGWGTTDGLSAELSQIMMIIIGGYFIDTVAKRFTKRG